MADVLVVAALIVAAVVQLVVAVAQVAVSVVVVAAVVVVAVVVADAVAVAVVVVVGPLIVMVVEIPGYLDYSCLDHCLVPFCCRLVACDAGVVVADSFHVRLTVDVAGDELVVVHDDFGSVEIDDAALLVVDDGMAVVDCSSDHHVGSSRAVVRNSCRDCYAAVYPDGTGADHAGNGAVVLLFLIGSVGAVVAVTVGAGEVGFELDQALASESSALLVVVPCSVVVDTVADDEDDVFRCHHRDLLRPSLRHCWGHFFQRLAVLPTVMVQSPVGVQLAAESA